MSDFSFRLRDPIRVTVLGTGQMGSGIARLALEKQGLKLVGAFGRRVERAGRDLGRVIGLHRDLGIPISADLDSAITASRPHIAIQATCSRVIEAAKEIAALVDHGIHVISIAEEMAYPARFARARRRIASARWGPSTMRSSLASPIACRGWSFYWSIAHTDWPSPSGEQKLQIIAREIVN